MVPRLKALLHRWRELRDRHRWLRWGTDALIVLLLLVAVSAWQTRHLIGTGEPAPAFMLTDLSGKQWSSAELKGKKVVLHFWAPWCGVCRTETDTYSKLRESVGDEAHVLSVALAYRQEAEVRRFVEQEGVDYPVLLGTPDTLRDFRVNVFPTTYFLSEDGTIRHQVVGYTTGFGFRWRLWW